MTKKTTARKMTFRQRLRAEAEERLDNIRSLMTIAAMRACEEANTDINPHDVMRLVSGTQTKSLRTRLITELANEKEAELEKIYNNQQDLGLESTDD